MANEALREKKLIFDLPQADQHLEYIKARALQQKTADQAWAVVKLATSPEMVREMENNDFTMPKLLAKIESGELSIHAVRIGYTDKKDQG